jgi:hypothetical protein
MSTKEQREKWKLYQRERMKNPKFKTAHTQQQNKYKKKLMSLGLWKNLRGKRTDQASRWRNNPKNKIKKYAHQQVWKALKKGLLKKDICQICKTDKYVCGHHPDYSRPLEVIWLCNLHHYQLHKGIIKI